MASDAAQSSPPQLPSEDWEKVLLGEKYLETARHSLTWERSLADRVFPSEDWKRKEQLIADAEQARAEGNADKYLSLAMQAAGVSPDTFAIAKAKEAGRAAVDGAKEVAKEAAGGFGIILGAALLVWILSNGKK